MKNITGLVAVFLILLSSCNNNHSQPGTPGQNADSQQRKTAAITTVATASNPIASLLENYLQLKNALANDKGYEAAGAAQGIVESLAKIDTTSLSPEQKNILTGLAGDIKENAVHITLNGNKIEHQRRHFETLTNDLYDILKVFKGERQLYYDYCPMYNNNLGAYWISETKEIRNPYLGKKMPTCGTVKEDLK